MLTPYADGIDALVAAELRGLVNELGFRLYVKALELRKPIKSLTTEMLKSSLTSTIQYIQSIREIGTALEALPRSEIVEESTRLAVNIGRFFEFASLRTNFKMGRISPSPEFRGCGWLDECQGDFLSAGVLVEVKAGERSFRGIDIRQILIYCALNFAAKSYDISHMCLLNPRLGVFFGEPLERVCQELSGRTASEVLAEIVRFVSDPVDQYLAG